MSFHEINFQLPISDRRTMRRTLISTMLNEEPGTGIGPLASRYQYNVEYFQQYGIYLKRPTQLNKGFDFTVNTRGLWFKKNRRYSNPSHQDIFDALKNCKSNFAENYKCIVEAITEIYHCRNVDFSTPMGPVFNDYDGQEHPIEIILLAIKWLFMEQDCAYWNYSGRAMLYLALQKEGLA
ncbi:MAG: hypothetical protein GX387_13915 [Clostridium sp.]|nr:hypothetical protein [Clostridium sp.]